MPRRPTLRERLELRLARGLTHLSPRTQVRLSGKPPVLVDGQRLEPDIQLLLSLMERRNDPLIETLDPEGARALMRDQMLTTSGPPLPVGAVRDLTVDGADGPLRARHYAPLDPGGPHPLLVFFHGGGFVIGDLDTHEVPCRLLCRHGGVHVLSVDYRLAPEHPFPAAIEDCAAAFRWAVEHAEQLGADPDRIGVGGDSAGATLSAVITQEAVAAGGPAPAVQLLIYPSADVTAQWRSAELFSEGYILTRGAMDYFINHYAAGADLREPRFAPLHGPLDGLPPAFIVTAGFDPLRDEGEAYAAALREAGVPAAVRRFEGLIHGFINMTTVSRSSREATVEIAGALRALLGTARPVAAAIGKDFHNESRT